MRKLLIYLLLILISGISCLGIHQDWSGIGNTLHTVLLINGTGTTFTDVSNGGTESAITVAGDTTWSSGQQRYGTDTIYFDNAGDWLQLADNDKFALGNVWTFSVWIYPLTIVDSDAIFSQRVDWSNIAYFTPNGTSGDWRFYVSSGGVYNFQAKTSGDLCPANEWAHLEFASDGNKGYAFKNGIPLSGEPYTYANNGNWPNLAADMFIGSRDGTVEYNGYIAEMVFTKGRVLHTRKFDVPNRNN